VLSDALDGSREAAGGAYTGSSECLVCSRGYQRDEVNGEGDGWSETSEATWLTNHQWTVTCGCDEVVLGLSVGHETPASQRASPHSEPAAHQLRPALRPRCHSYHNILLHHLSSSDKHITTATMTDFSAIARKLQFTHEPLSGSYLPRPYRAVHRVLLQDLRREPRQPCAALRASPRNHRRHGHMQTS
jgi:hypothetical protein